MADGFFQTESKLKENIALKSNKSYYLTSKDNVNFAPSRAIINPSVKGETTSINSTSKDYSYIVFNGLINSIKGNTFPLALMKSFLDSFSWETTYIVILYEKMFRKRLAGKYPLIISSMRIIKDNDTQQALLALLKKQRFYRRKTVQASIKELLNYWL